MQKIYLDNAATTKVDPKAVEAMLPYFTERYGNPSSIISMGIEARKAIENARKVIARSVNAEADEIVFTSGGTESNNFALKSAAFTNKKKGNHIITTKIEHKCILKACEWLEKQGFDITYLDVDNEGSVDVKSLMEAITDKTILVSVIHGHNEVGTIQNLEKIGEVCRKHNVYFHSDACQSFTKVDIDVKRMGLDLLTLNAHKIHGPKGVGALYIKKGTKIDPWQHGGGQESGARTGTENVAGIVGFAEAVKIADKKQIEHMKHLRDMMIEKIQEKIPHTILNGPKGDKRLCNNINMTFKAIEGEALIELLDIEGITTSTGSACSSKSLEPSQVLIAMGIEAGLANSSIRLSISKYTTKEEIEKTVKILSKAVEKLRGMSPFKAGEEDVFKKSD